MRRILVNDKPYLERYYMGRLFGVTFYLHRFRSADPEPHLHNHPWKWGRALVLSGSYTEERATDLSISALGGVVSFIRRVTFWSQVNGNDFHRIVSAQPDTWTLFMHGERQRIDGAPKGWGFIEKKIGQVVFQSMPISHNVEWWHTADTRAKRPLKKGRGA